MENHGEKVDISEDEEGQLAFNLFSIVWNRFSSSIKNYIKTFELQLQARKDVQLLR